MIDIHKAPHHYPNSENMKRRITLLYHNVLKVIPYLHENIPWGLPSEKEISHLYF